MPGGNGGNLHETSQAHSGKHSRYGNDGDSQYKQLQNQGEDNKNNSQMIGIDGSVYSGLEIEDQNADMD